MTPPPEATLAPAPPRTRPAGSRPTWQETEAELAEILREPASEFASLIDPATADRVSYRTELAHFKRFVERWRADRAFREALPGDPAGVAARYALRTDPEVVRYWWDPAFAGQTDAADLPLVARRQKFFSREKLLHREKLRVVGCVPSDARHRLWRERQVNRSFSHLGPRSHDGIIHVPFAIELSDGCSVGCWFCGVFAEKKKSDFPYNAANAACWHDVLTVLRARIGTAASTGFLYWATDPLDNPDYEKFAVDFARICGRFPQTTTALAHKDVARTKALLQLSQKFGCTINRFSILSLGQFNRVMEAFTPDELLHCEIVPQNSEAVQLQSSAGRARQSERLRQRTIAQGAADLADADAATGTIACVSGFLINMVRRRVRLITPCPSSDAWPSGYWILEEGHFEDAAALDGLLEGMMERHMPTAVRANQTLRFRPDLRYETTEAGFRLRAFWARAEFGPTPLASTPYLQGLGGKISAGQETAGQIALELEERFDVAPENTFHLFNQLFIGGYLDEEPRPAAPQS